MRGGGGAAAGPHDSSRSVPRIIGFRPIPASLSARSPAPSGRLPWCGSPWSPQDAMACRSPPS
jgi:hypothetical protein